VKHLSSRNKLLLDWLWVYCKLRHQVTSILSELQLQILRKIRLKMRWTLTKKCDFFFSKSGIQPRSPIVTQLQLAHGLMTVQRAPARMIDHNGPKKAFEGVWPIIFDPSFLWWVFSAERAIIVQPSFLRYIFFVTNNRNLSFQLIFPTDESVIPIFCRVLLYCCTMGSWNFAWTVDHRKGSGVSYPTQRPELPELCVSGGQTHLR